MLNIKRFIPNQDDDLHCFQACFQMVYESLFDSQLGHEEVEQLTRFVAGRPTWPFEGMLSFLKGGLSVTYISYFALDSFIHDPELVLKEHYDEETVRNILEVSDFEKEKPRASEFLRHPKSTFKNRIPTLKDIQMFLDEGAFVIVNVNSCKLMGNEGYTGHFVLVKDIRQEEEVILHNPGLPPVENQSVTLEQFSSAWKYPDEKNANIWAVSTNKWPI